MLCKIHTTNLGNKSIACLQSCHRPMDDVFVICVCDRLVYHLTFLILQLSAYSLHVCFYSEKSIKIPIPRVEHITGSYFRGLAAIFCVKCPEWDRSWLLWTDTSKQKYIESYTINNSSIAETYRRIQVAVSYRDILREIAYWCLSWAGIS